LGDLNSANRYVYADDNPVNEVDPSGKGMVVSTFLNCLGSPVAVLSYFVITGASVFGVACALFPEVCGSLVFLLGGIAVGAFIGLSEVCAVLAAFALIAEINSGEPIG
jgi:hypothetical protein